MSDRPILFSVPMVRALLAGTKTQTRRVVKPQPQHPRFTGTLALDDEGVEMYLHDRTLPRAVRCPYGRDGDRLWVRETWARDDEDGALFYRADVGTGNEADDWQHNIDVGASGYRWRPSIHMPRAASRITLEITAVRVERLQDISEADAKAEGAEPAECCYAHYHGFRKLWEQINGPGSWAANPWVWVVSFKRIES